TPMPSARADPPRPNPLLPPPSPRTSPLQVAIPTCRAIALLLVLGSTACRRVDDPPPRTRAATTRQAETSSVDAPPPPSSGGMTVVVPDFAQVAAKLSPSVVTVIATVKDRNDDRRNKVVRGLGSGMIVTAQGQVLTNEHVIASATRIDVELSNGERIPARVLVAEPRLDLALLELEGDRRELEPVVFSERSPRPGEWVMAVGQPFGLGHTVTVGVISGLRRDHVDLGRPEGLRPDGIWSFIQTDAS